MATIKTVTSLSSICVHFSPRSTLTRILERKKNNLFLDQARSFFLKSNFFGGSIKFEVKKSWVSKLFGNKYFGVNNFGVLAPWTQSAFDMGKRGPFGIHDICYFLDPGRSHRNYKKMKQEGLSRTTLVFLWGFTIGLLVKFERKIIDGKKKNCGGDFI